MLTPGRKFAPVMRLVTLPAFPPLLGAMTKICGGMGVGVGEGETVGVGEGETVGVGVGDGVGPDACMQAENSEVNKGPVGALAVGPIATAVIN